MPVVEQLKKKYDKIHFILTERRRKVRTNSGLPWLQRPVLKIPNMKKTASDKKKISSGTQGNSGFTQPLIFMARY